MAVKVNPPPQIVLPEEFKNNLAVANYFEQLDRVLLQLWTRTGGSTDKIENAESSFDINLTPQLFAIRQQIGSGIRVTIDTTGFTVDTTDQTTDKTEQ